MIAGAKAFSTAAVLSASTGVMVCEKFSEVHELIEHLAGGAVWTHQIPAAMDALGPGLVGLFPWLAGIPAPSLSGEAECREWVAPWVAEYGPVQQVTAIEGGWGRDPIADLTAMVGPERVIPVVVVGPDTFGSVGS